MHLGHQYIINYVQQVAHEKNAKACVITFEPQPKEFFLMQDAPLRITPFRDKILALKSLNLDQTLCLQFNKKIAMLCPEAFVKNILVEGLNVNHIIIGDDFCFGYKRQGDFLLLKKLGSKYGFIVEKLAPYKAIGKRVSSSHIRKLLNSGQFDKAKHFLGHTYKLSGRIHYGNQNGRKIGFPTINIPMPRAVVISGVYVVNVHIENKVYHGIANIGIRPTIGGNLRLLETHIFNFTHDLYQQHVTIEFLHFIRSEKKFDNFKALEKQLKKDKQATLKWLQHKKLVIS